MADQPMDRTTLAKFAGLVLGIIIGGPLGPIVFGVTGLNVPAAATMGSFAGAVLGYAIVAAFLRSQRRRRDEELRRAAEAVKDEAHLPATLRVRVDDGCLILEGVVDDDSTRRRAKELLQTIPGAKGVINRVRVRTRDGEFATAPSEIAREIQERLRKAAEEDAREIHVVLHDARVVLEGRVRSWTEASAAEEAAWSFPGIVDVENRLEIAA